MYLLTEPYNFKKCRFYHKNVIFISLKKKGTSALLHVQCMIKHGDKKKEYSVPKKMSHRNKCSRVIPLSLVCVRQRKYIHSKKKNNFFFFLEYIQVVSNITYKLKQCVL